MAAPAPAPVARPARAAPLRLDRVAALLRGLGSFELMVAFTLYGVPLGGIPLLRPAEFLLNFLTIGLGTVMAIDIVRRRGWRLRRDVLDVLGLHLLFTGYMTASLAWSPDPFYFGIQKAGLAVIVGSWSILAVGILAEEPHRLRRLMVALLGIGLASATQYLVVSPDITTYLATFDPQATINNQQGSRLTGLGMVSAMVYFAYSRGSGLRAAGLLGLGVWCFLGQINTGGRTGLVATALVLMLLAALGVRLRPADLRLRRFVARMALVFLVLLAGLVLYILSIGIPRTIYRLVAFAVDPSATTARLPRYLSVWGFLAAAPLFGHGAGSWDFLEQFWGIYYPHNVLLESLAEFGLVGTALLLVEIGVPLWLFARRHGAWPRQPLAVYALLYFAYNFLQAMAIGDLGRNFGLYAACALLTLPAETGAAALWRGPLIEPAAGARPRPAAA